MCNVCCRAEQVSADHPKAQQLQVVSLYAAMAAEQQLQAFQPAPQGTRKVLAPPCLLYVGVISTSNPAWLFLLVVLRRTDGHRLSSKAYSAPLWVQACIS